MKLNNKGMSIIEIVLSFSLIMVMVVGMLVIVVNYRNKAQLSIKELEMDTFKNTLTQDIQNDILALGVKEINTEGECETLTDLSNCINIVFKDDTKKAFGISKVSPNDRVSVENKYLYYDGIKYELKDVLPDEIPEGRNVLDLQSIIVEDTNILTTDSAILEDGTKVDIYSIDVYVSHVDFKEDFGIHIVASTHDVSKIENQDEIKDSTNTLYSLGVTGYNITPVFNPEVTEYTLTLEEAQAEIYATTTSGVANVTGIGNKTLSWGSNVFNTVVTAEDGTIKIYSITITNKRPVAPVITGGSDSWSTTSKTISLQTAGSAVSGVKHYEYYKSTSSTAPTDATTQTGTTSGRNNKVSFVIPASAFFAYQDFPYTGSVEEFIVPVSGTYKLEVWGAQGGSATDIVTGGKGGYSKGNIYLTAGQKLYVIVGGQGQFGSALEIAGGYNGGGNSAYQYHPVGGGGGATHIATKTGVLSSLASSRTSVLIVAGGGGGASWYADYAYGYGGSGGGTTGGSGTDTDIDDDPEIATGGTQTSGGNPSTSNGNLAGFGYGASATTEKIGTGGGGGYYGGGFGHHHRGGGGGSGYIGGVTSGSTIVGTSSMPTHDGKSTMVGNSGNGYAKITLVSAS